MIPRANTGSPLSSRDIPRFAAVALLALAGVFHPVQGSAALRAITTRPPAPTTCDSVGLLVAGVMPDPCYHVIRAEIEGPTDLGTAGPIPTFGIRVQITVQQPDPRLEVACPAVLQPYERGFRLGALPIGRYLVEGVEYTVPFSPDSTGAATDSSKLDGAFDVRGASPCPPPGKGCALLSFAPSQPMRTGQCDGTGIPGGTACFDVVLMNGSPAAGVQTEIAVFEPGTGNTPISPDLLRPISVDVARPGTDFQVAWTADGSKAKIVLFSASNATIPAGEAHILRVCYAVGANAAVGRYPMRFQNTVVADPDGAEIPPCLTFAEIVGSICVVPKAGGCDLNGDGASDILDIVQLVHCALAPPGGNNACPDTVMAKADCNGDGVVNVRDVICCVRRILEGGGFGSSGGAPGDPNGATTIGFTGPARWITPFEGRATIEIVPGTDFAGIQFGINSGSSPARIREVRLLGSLDAYQLETSVDPGGGIARVMLFPAGIDFAAPRSIRLEAILEPAIISPGKKAMSLFSPTSANQAAQVMATLWTAPTAEVPQSPAAAAPSLSAPSPNPFAVGAEVAYAIPTQRRVTLRVYSVSGRLVRTLVDATVPAGVHRAVWDGRDAAGREARSGIYFFKLTAGGVERTARGMRLR